MAFVGGELRRVDIGVTREGRLTIGSELAATDVLDASGRVVAPGFIDVLADGVTTASRSYLTFEKFKLTDGVTTALQMHGGSHEVEKYYGKLASLPHWINHGVSTKVMLIRYRHGAVEERYKDVERCLEEGALGVSHSIEYQPTPWEELEGYARLARKYNRPFFLHLRYSSAQKELEGVDEAIRLAQETGVRVHLDHLHSTGGTFHMEEALERIRIALAKGLRITACVYPYSYWATYLDSRRFAPGWQQRYGLTFHDLQVVGSGERLTEESFNKYRGMTGVLVAVPPGTMDPEKTIDLALKEDFCLIGSDGGILSEPRANNHPRGAGCFSAAVRYGLDIGLSLEKILAKFTLLPRQVIGAPLELRGVLEEGAWADLTVFDPKTIEGSATVDDPNRFSKGIDAVVVNGRLAYRRGALQTPNGRPVRAGGRRGGPVS
jgi:N-acyl-D-aspartate/D-glutamate deacylase